MALHRIKSLRILGEALGLVPAAAEDEGSKKMDRSKSLHTKNSGGNTSTASKRSVDDRYKRLSTHVFHGISCACTHGPLCCVCVSLLQTRVLAC